MLSGKIKEEWGKLTDDEITQIEGKKDKLLGRLQEKYGYSTAQAEHAVHKFYEKHRLNQEDK